METTFGTIVIVVAILGGLAAVLTFLGTGKLYQGIGKGAFSLDGHEQPKGPKPGSAQARAESEEELRQLLEAKSYRRVQRGEEPLDVDAEMAALTAPAPSGYDAELEEEVRQLVVARNERRMRKGEEPFDVEEEVRRQLRDAIG